MNTAHPHPSNRKRPRQQPDHDEQVDDFFQEKEEAPLQQSSKESPHEQSLNHADVDHDNSDAPPTEENKATDLHSTTAKKKKKKKRRTAPLEVSSKHPPHSLPASFSSLRVFKPRDPRFDSTLPASSFSQQFNASAAYSFIDELKQQEIDELKHAANKVKSVEKKTALKKEIQRRVNELRVKEKQAREKHALNEWKAKEHASRREGKGAYYLKPTDVKRVQLIHEYARAQDRGGAALSAIRKKVEKKRKQRKAADQRYMPQQQEA